MTTQLVMCDRDIIAWARDIFGAGRIGTRNHHNSARATQYGVSWNGIKARNLALSVAPYMSLRRRTRIEEITGVVIESVWRQLPIGKQTMWAAGYIEGEACFTSGVNRVEPYRYIRFWLTSTDQDAVQRVGDIVGLKVRRYHSPSAVKAGQKPIYATGSNRKDTVKRIAADFYPLLFSRRRAKIIELVPELVVTDLAPSQDSLW